MVHFIVTTKKGDSKGLCCPLLTPCEKIIKKPKEDIEIKSDEILIDKTSAASNSYNDILKGVLKGTIHVAIKYAKYAQAERTLLNEIEIMKEIDHKNIVRLMGTCISYPVNVFVCMESMANCSLKNLVLSQSATCPIDKYNLMKVTQQLCAAMSYLIKKFIIHRDLCCKNVFIGTCFFVKLGNFTFAKHLDLNNQYLIKSDVKEGTETITYIY
jgi:serine/threonine protein kinase